MNLLKSLLAIFVLMIVAAQSVSGAVLKVRNLDDDGSGSLRQAIQSAANGDRIEFRVVGQIQLLTGALLIEKDLVIEGPSSGTLVLDAGGNSCIFNISQTGAEVTLRRLKLINGHDISGGGAITSVGDLTVDQCQISNSEGGTGGGVLNVGGKLRIDQSAIVGNFAGSGGGVATVDGALQISNSRIDGNVGISGGGIEVQNSMLALTSSSVSSNRSQVNAAGIEFYLSCTASVQRCQFVANEAGLAASAISTDYGCNITLQDTTFAHNVGNYGDGGAIMNWDVMTVTGCTFVNNRIYYFEDLSSGGAIYNSGLLSVENSTFSGNRSGFHGGAIMNYYQVFLRHCTLTGNESRYGGALSTFDSPDVSAIVENCVIAQNTAAVEGPDVLGSILSLDYNLFGEFPTGTVNGSIEHTLFGTAGSPLDALLGSLQFNGGPTPTHLPLLGSPAIDAGSCTGLKYDQRGYHRPVGASCDIGSVEVQ